MRTTRTAEPSTPLLIAFALALALLIPGISAADRESNPGEVLNISDEIFGRSVSVTRGGRAGTTGNPHSDGGTDDASASAGPGPGNDENRSGLGDDTIPTDADGTDNSPNEGTDNPNQVGLHGNPGE